MKAAIANIVFPSVNVCTEEPLYFRCNEGSYYRYDTNQLYLPGNTSIKFDTYFNSLSIGKWTRHTIISEYSLALTFTGKIVVKIGLAQFGHSFRWLASSEIESQGEEVCVDIPVIDATTNGIIIFECISVDDSIINAGRYYGVVPQEKDIKLGVVITTFNRIPYVKQTVDRLRRFIENNDLDIKVIVIDNGRNVDIETDENIELIQNNNLGGAGGFARGLYQLRKNGTFTHCLFMDDDALSEVESVFRGYKLLAYSNNEQLAVAGSMLLDEVKFVQHENGARFYRRCFAIKHGMDLRDPVALIHNEIEEHIDYGAWWYFGFSLKAAKEYPYPYFIRGDDINFSLKHDFEIITLNGINTWQSNFEYKASPLTLYLDIRSHILHHVHHERLISSYKTIMSIFWPFFIYSNLKYQYYTARAIIESVDDVLSGPEFIENNVDLNNIRAKLQPCMDKEKLLRKSLGSLCAGHCHRYHDHGESRITKYIRNLTLNGHLIPKIFFRHAVVVPKVSAPTKSVFMNREVVFYHDETGEGFVACHDKYRFFLNLILAIRVSIKLFYSLNRLKRDYNGKYKYLTSEKFWLKHFIVK